MGFIVRFFLSLSILILANGCSKRKLLQFSNNDSSLTAAGYIPKIGSAGCQTSDECILIKDSFERDNVLDPNEFYWQSHIDDYGFKLTNNLTAVDDIEIGIYDKTPTTDGDRSLFFTGRKGDSVHSMYLISHEFDLSAFEGISVDFDYVMAGFESWSFRNNSGLEHLKVDVCTSGAEACGLIDDPKEANKRLESEDLWVNIFAIEASTPLNQNLDGTNHTVDDFGHVRDLLLNLNNNNFDKSKVMIRWNIKLDEGLSADSPDAGILDNIIIKSVRGESVRPT